ncbi:MAG: hypothetical protein ACR2KX_19760 [Chitinophagaceae bacterium]
MKMLKNWYALFLIVVAFACLPFVSAAQNDTIKKRSLDEYLLTRKGIFGKLVKVLMTDTARDNASAEPQRNDIKFQPYSGKIIRDIQFKRLNFGTPISDTAKEVSTVLTRLSNKVHRKTYERIIENNLFFRKNDSIQPYLLADNERYLRDLPYLNDAKISVIPLLDNLDSVDIAVFTKDVLSIGAEVPSVDLNNTKLSLTEENLAGTGNRISIRGLFDKSRAKKIGYGAEYIWRNISGSFLDAYFGYQNFNSSINGNKEENAYYIKLIRPLVNSYMRWTYALEASRHQTQNMYFRDSLFLSDYRYSYNNLDIWGGLNVDATFLDKYVRGQRLRALVALRLLSQKFDALPVRLINTYDSRYADITGGLATVSVFARDFYKTQYIYGFGRNEDIPEGIDVGFTAGFTRKQNKSRPYLGIKFERYYFTSKKRYLDFTVRLESSLHKKNFEDITALGNVDFFSRLKNIGRWKQRTFLSAGITWQINSTLNEPLYLESRYGLPEFSNGYIPGYIRTTVKGESVFYTPLSLASFRFAPFVFYNTSLFTPRNSALAESKIYSSIGGGLRTRNESLIFGTIELRAYYFPRKNFNNGSFRIDFNSNLKFKYNSQLGGRPDFIQAN